VVLRSRARGLRPVHLCGFCAQRRELPMFVASGSTTTVSRSSFMESAPSSMSRGANELWGDNSRYWVGLQTWIHRQNSIPAPCMTLSEDIVVFLSSLFGWCSMMIDQAKSRRVGFTR